MKRFWAPVLAVATAALVLVPSTFAVGEPGTTLYAQLGQNRFPNGSAAADARLHFLSQDSIRLDVTILGLPSRPWGVRIYSAGSCNAVLNWVANRDQNGNFIQIMSNSGLHSIDLFSEDVARIRLALARGQSLAFMVAGTHPVTGQSYRTCTAFTGTPRPPITSTTSSPVTTTAAPTTTASATGTTTGTGTTTATTGISTINPCIVGTGTTVTVTNSTSTQTSVGTVTVTGQPTRVSTTGSLTCTFTTSATTSTVTTGTTTTTLGTSPTTTVCTTLPGTFTTTVATTTTVTTQSTTFTTASTGTTTIGTVCFDPSEL